MDDFKSGELRFLVATDVASRGIDVPQLDLVVNVTVQGTPTITFTGLVGQDGPSEKAKL